MRSVLIRIITIVAVASLAMAGTVAQKGDPLEEQLKAAIQKELLDGSLKDAIAQYQKIINTRGASRPVVARALLQLGGCYEKLGELDARKAYERLVQEFADQTQPAEAARGRLTFLTESQSRASAGGVRVRKVWSGTDIDLEGEVSPDGNYIAFVDWDTGDLAICDLLTGIRRRVTDNGASKESGGYAAISRWSPDGKQIVYMWYDSQGSELRVVNLDNPKPRLLYRSKQWQMVEPCDWSSDGKQILAYESRQYRSSEGNLLLVAVSDGASHVLKTLGQSFKGSPRLSPDGRYVAIDVPQRDPGPGHDIFLLSVDGGRQAAVVSHAGDDWVLNWSPDGRWLIFASDRAGALGIWAIQVVNGAAAGDAQSVKAGLPGMIPMGLIRRGSFYYGQSSRNENIYVARLDPSTGRIVGSPENITQRFEGLCGTPAFSPDGKNLAYACSSAPISGFNGRNILRIRSLETGKDREFSTEFSKIFYPRWLPDGRFLLISGHNDQGQGIYKVDTQTWEMKLLFRNTPEGEPSRDGKGLFYARRETENNLCRILFRNFEKGEEKELYRGSSADSFNVSLSPDGKWLAFLNRTNPRILRIIPTDGGPPRELFRFALAGGWNILMTWTADGKYVLFSKPIGIDEDKGDWDLWRVPAAGGEAQRLGAGMNCEDPSTHPDGRQITFSSIKKTMDDEVWVIENFLAGLKPVK
jgi:Tol biopolymer transport system component